MGKPKHGVKKYVTDGNIKLRSEEEVILKSADIKLEIMKS
jgi:hypothetical protein